MSKIVKLGISLVRLLEPLLKAVLPLIGNVLKPLTKSVLALTVAVPATDADIQMKFLDLVWRH